MSILNNTDNQQQYCSLADLKGYLNIASSDTSKDTLLNTLIAGAMAFVDKYTLRTFGWGNPDNIPSVEGAGKNTLPTTDLSYFPYTTEFYDGIVGKTIFLRNSDITNIDSLKIGQISIGNQVTLDPTQYVWHEDGRIILGGAYFNSYDSSIYTDSNESSFYGTVAAGYQTIEVTYHYGYYGVPADIKLAALDICTAMYTLRNSLGMESERVGDYQVNYDVAFRAALKLQPDSLNILNRYKRIQVG